MARHAYAPKDSSSLGRHKGGNPLKGMNGAADCSGAVWGIYRDAGLPYTYRNASIHFFDLVLKDGEVPVKGRHYFKQVSTPQTGDVGWWNGHVAIFDLGAGLCGIGNKIVGNVWSASRPGGRPFGPGHSSWYDKEYKTPAKWFRYWRIY